MASKKESSHVKDWYIAYTPYINFWHLFENIWGKYCISSKSSNPTVQPYLQLQLRHGTKNTIDVALQTNKNCLVPRRTLPGSYLRKISVYRWGGGFYDWGKIGEKRNLSVAIFHLFRYKYWKVRFKYGANECLKIEWNMFYRCGLRHFV